MKKNVLKETAETLLTFFLTNLPKESLPKEDLDYCYFQPKKKKKIKNNSEWI